MRGCTAPDTGRPRPTGSQSPGSAGSSWPEQPSSARAQPRHDRAAPAPDRADMHGPAMAKMTKSSAAVSKAVAGPAYGWCVIGGPLQRAPAHAATCPTVPLTVRLAGRQPVRTSDGGMPVQSQEEDGGPSDDFWRPVGSVLRRLNPSGGGHCGTRPSNCVPTHQGSVGITRLLHRARVRGSG